MLTDNFVCVTFTISKKDPSFVAQDFSTIDSTFATVNAGRPALKGTDTQSISNIAHIQNDSGRRACRSTIKRSTGNCARPEVGRRTVSMMPCKSYGDSKGKPRRIVCL
ncbi:MAG: hypothetical protein QXH66_00370 [Conexivisphaerales archaeon]